MKRSIPDGGSEPAMDEPLLTVRDLWVGIDTRDGIVHPVRGFSFDVRRGETLAILGESGSGKSITSLAIMGILDPPARVLSGSIRLGGLELVGLPDKQYRRIRGARLGMVFQDALSALNPVVCVGRQVAEMYRVHRGMSRSNARLAAIDVMERVRIPAAAKRYGDYPHQFSGGMRQRILIAMMIALKPEVLIADEPTTALDVTVQSQILDLLREVQLESEMALVLITHDLTVVSDVADRVSVVYAGRAMEQGPASEVLTLPLHPYTRGLLRSAAPIDRGLSRLPTIPGLPPSVSAVPTGCAFRPRCEFAVDRCREDPPAFEVERGRLSRCWFAREVGARD